MSTSQDVRRHHGWLQAQIPSHVPPALRQPEAQGLPLERRRSRSRLGLGREARVPQATLSIAQPLCGFAWGPRR